MLDVVQTAYIHFSVIEDSFWTDFYNLQSTGLEYIYQVSLARYKELYYDFVYKDGLHAMKEYEDWIYKDLLGAIYRKVA